MTRFEREIRGILGETWKRRAEREIETFQEMADNGEIFIDKDGAARWKTNNRCLPSDCIEKLTYTSFAFDPEATNRKREEENEEFLTAYRKNHKTTSEEWSEMRSIFGEGTPVINILTGEVTTL